MLGTNRRVFAGGPLFGILLACLFVGALLRPSVAEAQYKSQQLGFEAGYQLIEDDFGLDMHSAIFGLRAGYKADDHWWYTARAMVSFLGNQLPADQTTVLFHLTPVDFRYYFLTDDFRPYLGGATAFHFLVNFEPSSIQWGFGPVGGIEIKLERDLFLGFEVSGMYMIAFDHDDSEILHATTQLIFFL